MTEPAYPAARAVAATVEDRFARLIASARDAGRQDLAPEPDAGVVEAVIDAAFWASLRREEGRSPRISLAFLPPERAEQPLLFTRPLPLAPGPLTRLAPAVEGPGIHLGVWRGPGGPYVWGATHSIPPLTLVVEVVEPGLLVVKYRRGEEFGKFGNVAVLQGDQVKEVDEHGGTVPDCPALLSTLLGLEAPASWGDAVNGLVQIAVSMRRHGRGGSLLVVPGASEAWRESIVHPIAYGVTPPFDELAGLMLREPEERSDPEWQDALTRVVDLVGGLTAVDGATVVTDRYELLAFGAKIVRRAGSVPVEQVFVTEPVVGGIAGAAPPGEIGGTRHMSAAQFVHDQRDALALVASQDGRFTIFAWSPCEHMVHAHRVETLLM